MDGWIDGPPSRQPALKKAPKVEKCSTKPTALKRLFDTPTPLKGLNL